MSLAAGALSKTLVNQSTALLLSAAATGGTGPYTYQWYRSTTTGFSPGAGSLLTGATSLTLNDSGLLANTTYYYKVIATDTGNSNATATSSQLTVLTEPGQNQNQFAQTPIVGVVDLQLGSVNIISCLVDSSIVNNTATFQVINPGQGVKIVANTAGGVPRVLPVQSSSDSCFGFCVFNIKDISYGVGAMLEVAMFGTVIWCFATGAVTQMTEVCLDVTYVGGVQATGNSATIMGLALDGASAAGPIRVMLTPNPAFSTA